MLSHRSGIEYIPADRLPEYIVEPFGLLKARKTTGTAPTDPPVTMSDVAAVHEEQEGLYPNLLA